MTLGHRNRWRRKEREREREKRVSAEDDEKR
jgi:hypothetical protein